jgi:hypothetical protein
MSLKTIEKNSSAAAVVMVFKGCIPDNNHVSPSDGGKMNEVLAHNVTDLHRIILSILHLCSIVKRF